MLASLFTTALPLEALYALSAGLAMAALAARRSLGPAMGTIPMPAEPNCDARIAEQESTIDRDSPGVDAMTATPTKRSRRVSAR